MTQRRTYFQPFVSHPNLQSMCFTASLFRQENPS